MAARELFVRGRGVDGSHFIAAFPVAYARTRASCLTRAMLPARAACAQNFSPPVAPLNFLTDVQKEREREREGPNVEFAVTHPRMTGHSRQPDRHFYGFGGERRARRGEDEELCSRLSSYGTVSKTQCSIGAAEAFKYQLL